MKKKMQQWMLMSIVLIRVLTATPYGTADVKAKKEHGPGQSKTHFIDTANTDLSFALPIPPETTSHTEAAELQYLQQLQSTRTQQQIVLAQADASERDIFIFRSVFGKWFAAGNMPQTAQFSKKISEDIQAEEAMLKHSFVRSRPFQVDEDLHPVCRMSQEPDSYPSGHALSGYLYALVLSAIVPEMRTQVMQRANQYAQSRLVCGVHYPSDVAASKTMAEVLFGSMIADAAFRKELSITATELRSHLR